MKSLVILLFFTSSPSAIFGRISLIVVDAVNCAPLGSFSHVFKKTGKRFPSVTHSYPSFTIVGKFLIVRITASLNHCVPALISAGRWFSGGGMSVFRDRRFASTGTHNLRKATAGLGMTRLQSVSFNDSKISTVAQAEPSSTSANSSVATNYNKESKILTSNVLCKMPLWHRVLQKQINGVIIWQDVHLCN